MPLTPEEQAMIANYWGAAPAAPAPAPAPRQMQDFARTSAPTPGSDEAIAAAYFAGQKPLPAAPSMEATIAAANGAAAPPLAPFEAQPTSTLPPVDTTTPGNLFGQRSAPPAQAPGREPPPPTVRQPAAFQREMVSGHPVAPAAPAGSRGPVNSDPFGAKAAMKGYLGTFDSQMDAVRREHTAQGDKALHVAAQTQELARRREEDASIANIETQASAEHFDERMSEIERQLDDVRAKKIDPNRLMRESPGMGLLAVIGGVIGGVYQGLTNGQENGFLRDLNRMIDRDIAAQERDMDNDRHNFGEKLNLLSQQRAVWKDTQLAKMQSQNLYYEAAKENIAAEAARYDTPIYQARADEAIANIQRAQDEIRLKLAQQLQAQAAAAGARSAAQAKEVRDVFRETYDKALAAGLAPAQAEFEASRVVDVLYAGGKSTARGAPAAGGDPISMVPKDQRHEALEEQKKYASAQKAIANIEKVFADYEQAPDLPTWTGEKKRDAVITAGRLNVRQALGEGFSSDKDTVTYVEKNLPEYMEPDAARRQKLDGLKAFLAAKASTPILDRHAPGWREQSPSEQAKTLGLKPVK